MWDAITGLIAEVKRCEEAGATTAAVAMAFIAIDTMAFLGLPEERDSSREEPTSLHGSTLTWRATKTNRTGIGA